MGLFRAVGGLVKKAAGAAIGFATGGPAGAVRAVLPSSLTGSRPALPSLPATSSLTGGVPQIPRPGLGGAVQRILPGGRSGYLYDPYDLNTPRDKLGRPVAVQAEITQRMRCPPGYVSVDLDGDGRADACVQKSVARAMGLFKSRPKPPVSGYDARAIRRAGKARKRVAKLAARVGFTVSTRKGKKPKGD